MSKRGMFDLIWDKDLKDIDVLITHGPPLGILDYVQEFSGKLRNSGCEDHLEILKRIPKLRYNLFGHIHNNMSVVNSGIFKPSNSVTTFVNSSVVTDGGLDRISSNGNIIHL